MRNSLINFRFYEELNNYLPEEKRRIWFEYDIPGTLSIQEVLQSLNIPVDEIDLILVNQQSQGLEYLLQDGDRVSVYPVFESFDLSEFKQIRETPLRIPCFVCDVHLGRLCKYLRMLGWDTLYSNHYTPDEMIALSRQEKRILLSRSYQLARHKELTHTYWIRSANPHEQLKDVISRLDLSNLANPLTRCLNCNEMIVPVNKNEVLNRIQERTAWYYNEFYRCPACKQVYWKGSHYENMIDFIHHFVKAQ